MRNDFSLQMTEQQQHLKSLLSQRDDLITESNKLNNSLNVNRETFLKVQGVIEYLTQTGVELPEDEKSSQETPSEEVEKEDPPVTE